MKSWLLASPITHSSVKLRLLFLGYAHTFLALLYFPAVSATKVSLHQSTPHCPLLYNLLTNLMSTSLLALSR